ncbi:MAG: hypothetical protein JST79_08020 [Acidobacteria bacterium]|nr:hypothetical protein [Acidobacteriota bacterium]
MAANPAIPAFPPTAGRLRLAQEAVFPGLRALFWAGSRLYASRGYRLLYAEMAQTPIVWRELASFVPSWLRSLTSFTSLTSRLLRDGFHALAVLPAGHMVAAVPGAILSLRAGEREFRRTHRIVRGTRPLHIAATPAGQFFWGEYFDNPARDEVHIYGSQDGGETWSVAYTFPRGAIRHVHNILYDRWEDCLWVLTGDNGPECRILRASCDFRSVETVLAGNQQARAVAAVPAEHGLYFASDTPLEKNSVYFLGRGGEVAPLAPLSSSSIAGCRAGDAMFFSTMVEPSQVNADRHVRLYGSLHGGDWQPLLAWKKDGWPMRFFQYGNAFLPGGENTSGLLALSTIAVQGHDFETSVWRVNTE